MSPVRIGYVPEHFSTPLYIARDNGFFKDNKVDVELVCCPGGTGEMTQKLKDKELDIAIALTEGLVAGIAKGQDWYKIVGTYVDAPLCWAISTGAESKHRSIDTLSKSDAAISRIGSGSHIMAYVLADQQGWLNNNNNKTATGEPFDFTVLNNFKAMRDAVNDLSSDFFMWETFTTKPYHDSGEVKRIGQITPPWPAFLFAAHTDLLESSNSDQIKQAILAIQKATELFIDQKENESVERIMSILDYPEQDVRSWFKTVHYAADPTLVSRQAIQVTVSTLIKAGVIERPGPAPEDVCDLKVAHLGD
ncbi:hypothetical protein PHYBLDRAFT_127300 [Phycomyces blakesleeanus NRRL 1555(-)]|uniref:Ca3427-like PBP 2 domain-containing protein n=2 Tax=Phycomyces blakesleeanus TaxID=4837 RepID=A0A167KUV3_PHYB8|nr:hypothetical protein PHYBLDRAFT_127300 [Phycomyces blakesleeanus NRRL 1555(-)]OAD68938.1 hypothetical protein PHYBLDRAFT_127300 [Phycomyces blakesleeanus NRRL 1555(-)]|eukprot:XP_018286978.1 hypothetical protein PHYBLDRAFT_127300 [Phycomyces blakesleeanus NRRL 1555(-)]